MKPSFSRILSSTVELAIALFLFLKLPASSLAETGNLNDIQQSREFSAGGAKAYQQKDFAASLRLFRKAHELRPYHPGLIYNVAALEAMAGSPDSSLAFLRRIAAMKLYFPVGEDTDFAGLQDDSRFGEVVAEISRNNEPIVKSEVVARIVERDLLTEGIAFAPSSGSFFVGSIYKRKVVRIGRDGKQSDFLGYPGDALFGVFGMAVNSDNQHLWLCTSDIDQIRDRKATETGKAAVVVCDLGSGRIMKRFEPGDTLDHIFGDLTLADGGRAYVSDSKTNVIYRVSMSNNRFETVVGGDHFSSLQGITLAGNHLFVADYAQGIFSIDLAGDDVISVGHESDICLLGIDGLYYSRNSLIAIQHGIRPHRIIRLFLNERRDKITRTEVLESNNPLFDEPTLGTIVGDDFYFIANSQWRKFKGDGSGPDEEPEEPIMLKIKLD